ncbi:MAG: ribose ABC transporter permease, partial [Lachnospiraceae bacterium]|nr:ribose ABC transporter permease [Lachnospiraceae bacterium]
MKNFVKSNAIWLVFLLEVIIFAIASKGAFIRAGNIVNISRQVAYYGIASIGMTFVILIAGIDLSIGSIITLVNVVCAFMMVNNGMNMWVAIIISLVIATLIGVLNGFMVATIGIPALIATFASQTI